MYSLPEDKSKAYVKVPVAFIEKYLPHANANFVKVYLTGLSQCGCELPLDNAGIAALLELLESDVAAAWRYWEKEGVVVIRLSRDNKPIIAFKDLSSPLIRTAPCRPSYTSEELSQYMQTNSNLRELFSIAQGILQKPLNSNDLSIIYSFYDFLCMPLDVIPMLLTYCMSAGKKSMRYIEKTAIGWMEDGIDTVEKAERFLKSREEETRKINGLCNAFGIQDRRVTDSELKYMRQWLFSFRLPIDLIRTAYDICAINTGKLSFPYIHTVLQSWHKDGITTCEQAKKLKMEPKKTPEAATPSPKASTKFSNFTQRPIESKAYDYKDLGLKFKK